jgi:hypothetical protein
MSKAQKDIEGRNTDKAPAGRAETTPAEGPHARPELTDHTKTPGSGALVDKKNTGDDADGGVG